MTAFRIKEYYIKFITKVYAVQGRSWLGWVTIKTFSACNDNNEDWWARACAENLLEELQKEQ